MKGKTTAWVVAIAAVMALLLFILLQFGQSQEPLWYEFYRDNEKQPYDVSVSSALLQSYFPGKQFTRIQKAPVNVSLPVDSTGESCYVFIGHSLYLSSDDRLRLFEFVRRGNEAFISANELPSELTSTFFERNHYYENNFSALVDSNVTMNLLHPKLHAEAEYRYDFIFYWEKRPYEWMHFNDTVLSNASTSIIKAGTISGNNVSYTNFLKVPYGKGAFYFHSNPIVFTNYELKSEKHFDYAGKVFSHLKPASIYWDEFSKIPQYNHNYSYENEYGETETPLRYILSQSSLKFAWYTLLLLTLLFLVFRTRRVQRIIPIVEPNTNTSLEYIRTISKLYFLQDDHKALAAQKMKLFLTFIRNRYAMQTKEVDRDFIKKLTVKSQVSENKIREIFDEYKTITNMENIPDYHLTNFHHQLDEFYRSCK